MRIFLLINTLKIVIINFFLLFYRIFALFALNCLLYPLNPSLERYMMLINYNDAVDQYKEYIKNYTVNETLVRLNYTLDICSKYLVGCNFVFLYMHFRYTCITFFIKHYFERNITVQIKCCNCQLILNIKSKRSWSQNYFKE